jgi:hypothetical protein
MKFQTNHFRFTPEFLLHLLVLSTLCSSTLKKYADPDYNIQKEQQFNSITASFNSQVQFNIYIPTEYHPYSISLQIHDELHRLLYI